MPSGKFTFTTDYFAIDDSGGTPVDLSTYVKSITVNYGRAEIDKTAAGDVGIARMAGLFDWSIDVELFQDFAASKVDATLYAIVAAGYEGTVSFRPSSDAQGVTNPTYAGEGIVFNYPMGLTHGEVAMVGFTIMGSDGAAMTRTAT